MHQTKIFIVMHFIIAYILFDQIGYCLMTPPRIYQAFIVLMIALYFLLPFTRIIAFPFNLLGIIVFACGAYLASSSKKRFLSRGTPMAPTATPTSLHTDGAFRYSRNPMYLGIAIGLAGLAIIFSSYLNFVVPIVFLLIMDRFFVRSEERNLEEVLGEAYSSYKKQVRRWI